MAAADYVIVGSGINALVAAAQLGRKGHKVLVVERNDRIGGCIRTEEITAPGFVHDVMATTFVLFITSPAFAELGAELEKRGLTFAHSPTPTAVLLPDGRHLILAMDRKANVAAFDQLAPGDGARFAADIDRIGADAPFLFALLGGSLWSSAMLKIVAREAWRRGLRGLAELFRRSARHRARLAGNPLSVGARARAVCAVGAAYRARSGKRLFRPDGQGDRVRARSRRRADRQGGAKHALTAFERLIRDHGGDIELSADVERVLLDANGGARGVRLAGGKEIEASKGVICSVTPNQLYGRLLADAAVPADIDGFRCRLSLRQGKLSGPLRAQSAAAMESAGAGGRRADASDAGARRRVESRQRSRTRHAAGRCRRSASGSPTALDPSRCPEGKSILWLQLPEAPRFIKGDAAGEIAVPADGKWTEAVREKYADRIEAILASHIENFRDNVIARKAYSPADLEALNINLVGGDPYGGFCGIDQFFIWRPFHNSVNHRTPVARLYHIGASTHPGPGLGGGSGYLVAKELG